LSCDLHHAPGSGHITTVLHLGSDWLCSGLLRCDLSINAIVLGSIQFYPAAEAPQVAIPYDWRKAPVMMEVEDHLFTEMKAKIEDLYTQFGEPVRS